MDKKILLIVDPQYDFMDEGNLPVIGSTKRMDALASYIRDNKEYSHIIITADWHPCNHSSFKKFGGIWPVHCVQHTHGAAINTNVHNACFETSGVTNILLKGNTAEVEEYSIFSNPSAKLYLQNIISIGEFDEFVFMGIAGDICLLNSVKGLMELGIPTNKITIIKNGTASIDENVLINFCKDNNINLV